MPPHASRESNAPRGYDDLSARSPTRETGEPLHPTLDVAMNLEAMAILDAGVRSATSGKLELVDDAA